MQRRNFARACLLLPLAGGMAAVRAHHGWSSFDQDRPLYLEGRVVRSMWQNPHAELDLELSSPLTVPPDLVQRAVPLQSAPVDGRALLAKATVPKRKDRRWEIELAPLTRLRAWKVPEITAGAQLAVLGFAFEGEKGDAVLRAEYLFTDGKVYGMRSNPV
jgi:Family of unknown function (DUF6152)